MCKQLFETLLSILFGVYIPRSRIAELCDISVFMCASQCPPAWGPPAWSVPPKPGTSLVWNASPGSSVFTRIVEGPAGAAPASPGPLSGRRGGALGVGLTSPRTACSPAADTRDPGPSHTSAPTGQDRMKQGSSDTAAPAGVLT